MSTKRRPLPLRAAVTTALLVLPAIALACGGSDDGATDSGLHDAGAEAGSGARDGGGSDATALGDGSPVSDGSSGEAGGGSIDGAPGSGDAAPPPPPVVCTPPAAAADTTHPTQVVGTGTAASCTASALAAAVTKGGIVTFDCGSSPATILLTSQIDLPDTLPIVIDGGNTVTIDGGGKTRLFSFNHSNSRSQTVTVTLQNLTLQNGHASGTAIPTPPANEPTASTGTMTDGGGGAIFIRDGELLVVNVLFVDNACAQLGPDVAGGAIYALQSLGVTVVGSRFVGNNGSNGGAIGGLFAAPLTVVNSTFTGNRATGFGGNGMAAYQTGSGGLGGAFYEDGTAPGNVLFCGDTVTGSSASSLGGAWCRVNEANVGSTTVDRCTFDGNASMGAATGGDAGKATGGGGAIYLEGTNVTVTASTISHNTTDGSGGGLRVEGLTLALINSTVAANTAAGLGAGLYLEATATITNVTFAGNRVPTGAGYFSSAIASPGGSSATIDNTVFADNTTADPYNPMTCAAKAFGGTDDVQWPQKRAVGTASDTLCTAATTFADPLLGALANNGGPTLTYLPGAGSPALKKGAGCPATDQRGNARPASGCTAGAVEVP